MLEEQNRVVDFASRPLLEQRLLPSPSLAIPDPSEPLRDDRRCRSHGATIPKANWRTAHRCLLAYRTNGRRQYPIRRRVRRPSIARSSGRGATRTQEPMRSRIRPQSLAAIALTALLAFAGSIAPVAGWSNRGDGYGTHDWILDQALRLLDERGIGHAWVDRTIALEATDDPDTVEVEADPARKIEHTYTATGRRGGAIHRITEHYAKLLRAYDANDDDEASYQLGMLAHFWGDLSMPYHTAQAAQEADAEHHAVRARRQRPDARPRPTSRGGLSRTRTGTSRTCRTCARRRSRWRPTRGRATRHGARQLRGERHEPQRPRGERHEGGADPGLRRPRGPDQVRAEGRRQPAAGRVAAALGALARRQGQRVQSADLRTRPRRQRRPHGGRPRSM